jgi:hypothetical protein
MGATLSVIPVSFVIALTLITLSGSGTGEDPFGRLTFENEESGLSAIASGRLETYQRALDIIASDPVTGAGMGATVVADYAFGGEEFATPGRLPNVDDAYLTAGMKGGLPALVVLGLLLAWPAVRGLRYLPDRLSRAWWLPAWIGMLALTLTQSFATTGYGPFLLGMLVIVFGRGYTETSVRPARAQE